jgi:glycosyltransferase involved in cell wall biosynthesis
VPAVSDAGVGIVVIGRNEGERLKLCLRSVVGTGPVVYVDSGSTDGSQDFARSLGVEVVELAVPPNFTAARARNAGVTRLIELSPLTEFVQTIDGDCEMVPSWLASGAAALRSDRSLGAVFGRLYERHPDRSIYNALCDYEWNTPLGDVPGFGGIAMVRLAALNEAGGYRDDMIAGEDSETAMRIRKMGWRIARIAGDMAFHDAAITRFSQWWRRTKRAGYAFAEMAFLHPDARWPNWPRTCRGIILWGIALPVLILTLTALALLRQGWAVTPAVVLLLAYPVQVARIIFMKRREGLSLRLAALIATLFTLGKLPSAIGLIRFHLDRRAGRPPTIIEYKGPNA